MGPFTAMHLNRVLAWRGGGRTSSEDAGYGGNRADDGALF